MTNYVSKELWKGNAMVAPITPKDAALDLSIPDAVIEAFNQCIK